MPLYRMPWKDLDRSLVESCLSWKDLKASCLILPCSSEIKTPTWANIKTKVAKVTRQKQVHFFTHVISFFSCYILMLSLTDYHTYQDLLKLNPAAGHRDVFFRKLDKVIPASSQTGRSSTVFGWRKRILFSLKALCTEDWESISRNFRASFSLGKNIQHGPLWENPPPKKGTVTSLC